MPRRLHFILGLVALLALAGAVPGAVARRLPDGWWPGSWVYEAWIAIVAVGFVALVVRAGTSGTR